MTAHKISSADTVCKDAKKNSEFEYRLQIRATEHAIHGSGAAFTNALQRGTIQANARIIP
jgi:uncharacterized protein (UPF0303 family)